MTHRTLLRETTVTMMKIGVQFLLPYFFTNLLSGHKECLNLNLVLAGPQITPGPVNVLM